MGDPSPGGDAEMRSPEKDSQSSTQEDNGASQDTPNQHSLNTAPLTGVDELRKRLGIDPWGSTPPQASPARERVLRHTWRALGNAETESNMDPLGNPNDSNNPLDTLGRAFETYGRLNVVGATPIDSASFNESCASAFLPPNWMDFVRDPQRLVKHMTDLDSEKESGPHEANSQAFVSVH